MKEKYRIGDGPNADAQPGDGQSVMYNTSQGFYNNAQAS